MLILLGRYLVCGLSDQAGAGAGTGQLTFWSVSGGRTMVLSMVLSTIFHSSFNTRFSTVFSQILANRIKLQRRTESVASDVAERKGPRVDEAPSSVCLMTDVIVK